ncbi:hypothetical protein ACFFRR_001549 [Megaselia abdita]
MRKDLFVILVVICNENVFGFLFGFGKFNFNLTREFFAPLRQEATARSHDYYIHNHIGLSSDHGVDDDDSVVIHNGLNAETTIPEDDNEPKIVNKLPNQPYENITDFSKFLYWQSRLYYGNRNTIKGLDIESSVANDLFKSGKLSTRAYALFPGTIWCGLGNAAPNDDSLGIFRLTDNCCREHDNCPVSISANEEKFGLTNTGFFARSHCDCDGRFYRCLKRARTIIAHKIGFTYFNLLRPQCFRKEHPIVTCLEGLVFGK